MPAWTQDRLPEPKELVELGILDADTPCRTKTLEITRSPMTVDNETEMALLHSASYGRHSKRRLATKEMTRVSILIGELTIIVLILGIIKNDELVPRALAGLQSVQVET